MKNLFSIVFVMLILLAGFHITISEHYCGGEVAASNISLTGNLALCGMEENDETCPVQGNILTDNCCEDYVTLIGITGLFTTSFTVFTTDYINDSPVSSFLLPYDHELYRASSVPSHSVLNPPGTRYKRIVSPDDICVFRI
jgi:hypothetical protein